MTYHIVVILFYHIMPCEVNKTPCKDTNSNHIFGRSFAEQKNKFPYQWLIWFTICSCYRNKHNNHT